MTAFCNIAIFDLRETNQAVILVNKYLSLKHKACERPKDKTTYRYFQRESFHNKFISWFYCWLYLIDDTYPITILVRLSQVLYTLQRQRIIHIKFLKMWYSFWIERELLTYHWRKQSVFKIKYIKWDELSKISIELWRLYCEK